MKNVRIMIMFFLIFSMIGIVTGENKNGGKGKNKSSSNSNINFDVQKKTEINGKIENVSKIDNGCCQSQGLRLRIRTRKGNKVYDVHLGPDYLFSNNDMNFKKGDNVSVDAFEGTFNDKKAYYASSVSSNGKSMILRYDDGESSWKKGSKNLNKSDTSKGGGNGKGQGNGKGKGKGKGKGRGKR